MAEAPLATLSVGAAVTNILLDLYQKIEKDLDRERIAAYRPMERIDQSGLTSLLCLISVYIKQE